jgi:hypothetical protein
MAVCKNGRFEEHANLYLTKVPNSFMGCPIKVEAAGIDHNVIITENYTHNDGSSVYKPTGLSVEILKLICEKISLTTMFLPPSLNMEIDSIVKEVSQLEECLSGVLTGVVPFMPVLVTSSFDATVPYTHLKLKCLFLVQKLFLEPKRFRQLSRCLCGWQ